MKALQVRSFVAWVELGTASDASPSATGVNADARRARVGNVQIEWMPRDRATAASMDDGANVLILGDDSEYLAAEPDRNLASGVPIVLDKARGSIALSTSIVGLPPILRYADARIVALASDVHMLLRIPGVDRKS